MLLACPLRGEEFAPYAVQGVVNSNVAHRNERAHRNSPVDLNLLLNEGRINLRTSKVIPIAAVIAAPAFTHRLASVPIIAASGSEPATTHSISEPG
jgi:hypothetical protein